MNNIIESIMKNIKSIRGNSLAEFAVTTAVMATLTATAAPRLSELSEGAKAEKTIENIDKIIKQAGNFYQRTVEWEGRGRFPGQWKFNHSVGGPNHGFYDNQNASTSGLAAARSMSNEHHEAILKDIGLVPGEDGWRTFNHGRDNLWISVFGEADANYHSVNGHGADIPEHWDAVEEWLPLFGHEALWSPYQDGHYAYTVVAGGGSGDDVYPPVIYVIDIENAVHYNNVLTP
tara:strand:- start:42 stop:737 length:696 start_codon:yes stop_codon:yes gene_type:complete